MFNRHFLLAAALVCAAPLSFAGVSYTCDPSINAAVPGLCNTLNTTTAALYNTRFTNLNAPIYITFGVTGLGSSVQFNNLVPYSAYVTAATAAKSGVQTTAAAALTSIAAPLYGTGQVNITAALGASLGISGMTGITSTQNACNMGTSGCYAAVIVMSNVANTFFYRNGGTEPSTSYDFFGTAEHETDEVLGTSSCIDTTTVLSDTCGNGIPSAVDLFRYSGPGVLISDSALSAVPGAYFSYDGGKTDAASGVFYNTLPNGDDYGDFVTNCSGATHIQDAEGCPGQDAGQDISNDGGVEISMLNALGYTLTPAASNAPTITSNGIVPLYSTVPTIQTGEWISIYGTNLAATSTLWGGNFPTSLANTTVTIGGKSAYLYFVSPGQINLQVPDGLSPGAVSVVVTTPNGSVSSTVTLASVAPSFMLLDGKHVAGIIVRSDGSGAYGGGSYDFIGPTGSSLGYRTVAAKVGDVVELFAVGLGPTLLPVPAGQVYVGADITADTVNMLVNNVNVNFIFAGLSGAGVYQINFVVPAGLGTGDIPLLVSVGGAQTPSTVVISLQ